MSIASSWRAVDDPDGWSGISIQNIDPYYLRDPNALKWDSGSVPVRGTRRLFEAYTPNSTKDHKTWKPFEHYLARTAHSHGLPWPGVSFSVLLGYINVVNSTAVDVYDDRIFNYGAAIPPTGLFTSGLTPWYVPRADGGFIPVPANLELLKERGLKSMLPKVKAELSSLVSLYEAKDILSIRGSAKNLLRYVRTLRDSRLRRKLGSKVLSRIAVRTAGDNYLQWKFNLSPLVSDICGIYHAISRFQGKMNAMVSRSATLQQAHFMCPLAEQTGTVVEPESATHYLGSVPPGQFLTHGIWRPFGSTLKHQRTICTDSAVFRCSMQYNYSYSAFQREYSKILGLLDMLGVNVNPRYIWDVIPWSFALDWVMDVGSWLDQFKVSNMEPTVNILQYCWSIKKSRTIKVTAIERSQRYYGQGVYYPPRKIALPEVRETSYRRGIDLPSASSFTVSGLSPTELSLGAALLVTRRRRHPRKP